MKKSIAAKASRWLLKNVFQRFAGSGFLGAFRIHRSTVRSEISKPSILSSPWILGDPHVGFSTIIRKISSLTSLLTRFLPATIRRRESHAQYCLNPAWCHRTTVSGWTMISACFQLHPTRLSSTQKNLSTGRSLDRGCVAFSTAICCRKARFSSNNLRRDDPARTSSPKNNLDNRSMRPLYQDIPCANRVRNAFLSTRVSIRRDHSSVPLSSRV